MVKREGSALQKNSDPIIHRIRNRQVNPAICVEVTCRNSGWKNEPADLKVAAKCSVPVAQAQGECRVQYANANWVNGGEEVQLTVGVEIRHCNLVPIS